ncbi:MAG: hypothetical protein ACRDOP_17430 [Gaiellaceae bacterium]
MTKAEAKDLQRDLNRFTGKFLEKFPHLSVDGDRGPLTNKRIVGCKFYIGYEGGRQRSMRVTAQFRRRLDRPTSPEVLPAEMIALGKERRRDQHERAQQSLAAGATQFDGRPVANWMKPYLEFARKNGWQGELTSGFRDPAHSEHICFIQCGAPSCKGTCAGRKSNHSGNKKPKGAIDVTQHKHFGELMKRCPLEPRIFNALGAADPEHFSATGR